jgi:hypothetical protein
MSHELKMSILSAALTVALTVGINSCIPRDVHPERSPRPSPSLLTGRQPGGEG